LEGRVPASEALHFRTPEIMIGLEIAVVVVQSSNDVVSAPITLSVLIVKLTCHPTTQRARIVGIGSRS